MSIRILFLVICFLSTIQSQADEVFENWASARALGMGNAFSSVVDDKDALFFNPAGLDRIQGIHLTLLDLPVGTDSLTIYQDFSALNSSNYASIIRNYYGKQMWLTLGDTMGLAFRGFAVAGYNYLNASFNLHNPAYSNVTINLTNDLGLIGGIGYSILPQGALRLGMAVKRVTRFGSRISLGPSTLATLSNSELTALVNNYGNGYGLDAGLLIELPVPGRPSFSAVWQDIGQTKFTPVGSSTAPPAIDNNAIAGFSLYMDLGLIKIKPAVDMRHINLRDEALGKKLHMGVEIDLPVLSLRGGLNQGYYTAGVGLDFKYFIVEAATYGVELNTYPGQKEDRRYLVEIILDFNMDPSFNNSDPKGRARPSVYQRR